MNNLNTDQFYAHEICRAVIHAEVDNDVMYLEGGLIVHSQWLTLKCRTLFCVSRRPTFEFGHTGLLLPYSLFSDLVCN